MAAALRCHPQRRCVARAAAPPLPRRLPGWMRENRFTLLYGPWTRGCPFVRAAAQGMTENMLLTTHQRCRGASRHTRHACWARLTRSLPTPLLSYSVHAEDSSQLRRGKQARPCKNLRELVILREIVHIDNRQQTNEFVLCVHAGTPSCRALSVCCPGSVAARASRRAHLEERRKRVGAARTGQPSRAIGIAELVDLLSTLKAASSSSTYNYIFWCVDFSNH